jgi:developmentally-regulated GTP-binding protein 1
MSGTTQGGTAAKIKEIEDEMARTQKNKATAKHLGMLKAKLAQLKRELIEPSGSGGGSTEGRGFDVQKSGDTRVGLIGFPSVGKSTLLCKLTGTFSEVGEYEFTTLTAIPGVIRYLGAKIQLLDLPGIIEGAKDGKGRGRQVIAAAKTCNVLLMVLDAMKPMTHKRLIEHELEGFGIRLNKQPPHITYRRKDRGGVNFSNTGSWTPKHLDMDTVKTVLHEYKIHNADVILHKDATVDELIDVIEGNRAYIPCLYVLNKIDGVTVEELDIMSRIPNHCPISAHLEWNLNELLAMVWDRLDLNRIYTKPRGQIPDYSAPIVLRRDKTSVEDFCNKIHRTLVKNFRYALVWGNSVKHAPQKVGLSHLLADEDIVQIVKK